MSTPACVPSTIEAGTTVTFTRAFSAYPPADWDATLLLRGPGELDVDATEVTDATGVRAFLFTISAAGSSPLVAGEYQYRIQVDAGPLVHVAERGTVWIEPDFATAAAGDLQSFDEKMLVAIEAELLRRTQGGAIETYAVQGAGGGTSVTRESTAELEKRRDRINTRLAARRRGGLQTLRLGFRRRRRLA